MVCFLTNGLCVQLRLHQQVELRNHTTGQSAHIMHALVKQELSWDRVAGHMQGFRKLTCR